MALEEIIDRKNHLHRLLLFTSVMIKNITNNIYIPGFNKLQKAVHKEV